MSCRHTVRAAAAAALALLLAAGCTGDSGDGDPSATGSTGSGTGSTPVLSAPAESPTPSPSISVPAGLSAEESASVDKAIEAYVQWVAAVDIAAQSGGTDLEPLKAIAVQAALIAGQNEAAIYAQKGWHSTGHRLIRRTSVRSVALRTDPVDRIVPEVIMVSCVESSHIDVVDRNGASVVTDWRRVFEYQTWVRYYPQAEYPQVGAGVDGWVVGQYENEEVESC